MATKVKVGSKKAAARVPKDATEAHEIVAEAALRAAQLNVVLDRVEVGEIVHQGDIYLMRVKDGTMPEAKEPVVTRDRKLAPGNNTGARHIIDQDSDVTIYETGAARSACPGVAWHVLLGRLIVARSAFTLTHPQHGWKTCPAGTYQAMFQVDARTMRRVLD